MYRILAGLFVAVYLSLVSVAAHAAVPAGIPVFSDLAREDPEKLKAIMIAAGAYKPDEGKVYVPIVGMTMHETLRKHNLLSDDTAGIDYTKSPLIEAAVREHGVALSWPIFLDKAQAGAFIAPATVINPAIWQAYLKKSSPATAASAPTANPAPAAVAVAPERLKVIETKSAEAAATAAAAAARATEVVAKVDADVKARNALNGKVTDLEKQLATATRSIETLRKQGDVKADAVAAAQAVARDVVAPAIAQAASAAEAVTDLQTGLDTAFGRLKATEGKVDTAKRESVSGKRFAEEALQKVDNISGVAWFGLILSIVAVMGLGWVAWSRKTAKPAKVEATELKELKERQDATEAQLKVFDQQIRCVADDGDKTHVFAMKAAQQGVTNALLNADNREVLRSHAKQIAALAEAVDIDPKWEIAPAEADAIKEALDTLVVGQTAGLRISTPTASVKVILQAVADGEQIKFLVVGVKPPVGQKMLPVCKGNVLSMILKAYRQKRLEGTDFSYVTQVIAEKASTTA